MSDRLPRGITREQLLDLAAAGAKRLTELPPPEEPHFRAGVRRQTLERMLEGIAFLLAEESADV